MEDVLMNNQDIRGFIDPKGILIRVANLNLGEDPVEIVAESIIRNVEKRRCLDCDMSLQRRTTNHFFRQYLIENYHYIYIHLQYKEECVEIKELQSSNVTDCQRNRIKTLCKNGVESFDLPKTFEKK